MQMGGDNFQKGGNNVSRTHHVVGRETLAAELHTPQMHEFHRMDAREQHFNEVIEHLRILILHSHQYFQRNYLFVTIPFIAAQPSYSTIPGGGDMHEADYSEPFSDLDYDFCKQLTDWGVSNGIEVVHTNNERVKINRFVGTLRKLEQATDDIYELDFDSLKHRNNTISPKTKPRFSILQPEFIHLHGHRTFSETNFRLPRLPGSTEPEHNEMFSINQVSNLGHPTRESESLKYRIRDIQSNLENPSSFVSRPSYGSVEPAVSPFSTGYRNATGINWQSQGICSIGSREELPLELKCSVQFPNPLVLNLSEDYLHEACSGYALDSNIRKPAPATHFLFTWAELNSVRPAEGPARGQVSRREVDRSRLNN
jgi:hypothetical protein